jgi:hypothetical protein
MSDFGTAFQQRGVGNHLPRSFQRLAAICRERRSSNQASLAQQAAEDRQDVIIPPPKIELNDAAPG